MRAPTWFPLLLLLLAAAGCGDTSPARHPKAPRDTEAPRAPSVASPDAPTAPTGSDLLAEAARKIDANLAGMRGEVAQRYARTLLEKTLPAAPEAQRPLLLHALQTGDTTERWLALQGAPSALAWDDAFFQAVLKQTQDPEASVRAAALQALRANKAFEDPAIERMWRVVRTAEPELRAALLYALGAIRQDGSRKADMLAALDSEHAAVRAAAAFSLSQLDLQPSLDPWPHDDVRAAFQTALSDADPQVRWWALLAFARMGRHAAPAAPEIAARLFDPEAKLQSAATSALLLLGDDAVEVLRPRVRTATRDQAESLAYVLRRLPGPNAEAALRAGLTHADPYIRTRMAMALDTRGVTDVDALRIIGASLAEEDPAVVLLALEGLGRASDRAGPYLDRIADLRTHPSAEVRRAAEVLTTMLRRGSNGR